MINYTSISEPKIRYLHRILDHIEKGALFVPKFQRKFVWKDQQRLDLLHSIKFGLPIGSLLVWETTQYGLLTYDKLGGLPVPPIPQPTPGIARTYLLDGHQRLSTLFGTLKRPADAPSKVDDIDWGIFYDLEDEIFLLPKRTQPKPTWMPVNVLLNNSALLRFLRTLKDEELERRADQLSKTFLEYNMVLVSIETNDLKQATLAFKRINSSGTEMGDVDMVAALSWSEQFDLREKLEEVRERLGEVGWETLEDKLILSACRAALDLNLYEANAEETSQSIRENPKILEEVANHLIHTAQFLAKHCGIYSPNMLPYTYQSVLLTEALRKYPFPNDTTTQELKNWWWRTAYTERFSGINEAGMQRALEEILDLAQGQSYHSGKLKEKIAPLPKNFNFASARAKLLVLRLAELKPQSQDGIVLKVGELLTHHGSQAMFRLIHGNSIPENCFLVEPVNSSKFRNYLLKLTDWHEDFLNSHAISPTAANALKQGNYKKFLEERRKTLIDLEKAFIQPLGLDYEEEE